MLFRSARPPARGDASSGRPVRPPEAQCPRLGIPAAGPAGTKSFVDQPINSSSRLSEGVMTRKIRGAAAQKKVGRSWHHHSYALRRRSMGQGDDRLPGLRKAPRGRSHRREFFRTRLSDHRSKELPRSRSVICLIAIGRGDEPSWRSYPADSQRVFSVPRCCR